MRIKLLFIKKLKKKNQEKRKEESLREKKF